MDGHVAHLDKHNADRIWLGNLERPLGTFRRGWNDMKISFKRNSKGVGWIHLARDKDQANTFMNLSVPQNAKLCK
jgi:hypothetical protein